MKIQSCFSVILGIGLFLSLTGTPGICVESGRHKSQTLFVFGDSFVDSGNIPKMERRIEISRPWYYPYGISNEKGPVATGRFSDFMVESDFIAKMLGLPMSPPTYVSTHGRYCAPEGMNFAFGGVGVYGTSICDNLREQVDLFKDMIKNGIISQNHASQSVALLSISGSDYKTRFGGTSNFGDITAFIGNVTTEIAANVERLQNLGVKRVLVNNLHPLGCTPSQCRTSRYLVCDEMGNLGAKVHNRNLKEKLGRKKGVLIVDMNTAFDNIIGQVNHKYNKVDEGSALYKKFEQRRKPCCEAIDRKGFCGQQGTDSKPLYSLCPNPSKYFFWDDTHPTHAGWEAVMGKLKGPIEEFLGAL